MLKLKFTQSDIEALHYWRFHHPHPHVQRKMEALYLKSQGVPHWQVAELLQVSQVTVRSYCKDYQQGGVEGLKELKFYQPQSELQAHRQTREEHFREHPPKSLAHAADEIQKLTGIHRSRPQVRQFLRSIGMRCRRVSVVPAKANPEVQETFKKTSWSLA